MISLVQMPSARLATRLRISTVIEQRACTRGYSHSKIQGYKPRQTPTNNHTGTVNYAPNSSLYAQPRSLDFDDRPIIVLFSNNPVPYSTKDNRGTKYQSAIIHVLRGGRQLRRPEAEEEDERQI